MTVEILSWRDLRIKNGDFTFDGGSKAFSHNQVIALVGANGAGKSTLLRCLVGLMPTAAGEVYYGGKSLAQLAVIEKARLASWCPSKLHVPFAYTCFELVLLGRFAFHQGLPTNRDRDLTKAALKRVDLAAFSNRTVDQLSSGELQRVMVARCLAAQTPLMFLDEPSANLDSAHAIAVFEVLQDLKQENITTIVSVHDINLANQYADSTLLLANGQILAAGASKDVLNSETLRQALHIHTEKIESSDGRSFFAALGPSK